MQNFLLTFILTAFVIFTGFSQTVETFQTTQSTPCDDMYVDEEGIIYTGKGGLSNKTNLGKILPDGTTSSVAQGMKGPISIIEAPNGLLYVTNYDDNSIKSYNRSTEEVLTVATGLDGPSGIAIDSAGVVYAANWGGAPNYNGHQIHRLFPDGTFEVFKDSPLFSRLQGIAFDDEGWLYVANTQNGRVFKLNTETAEMETLVTMGQNVVNMEYRDGYIYMASIQSNKIYRMNLEGEWSTFAGTGVQGGQDGPVETATFHNPIGVGFTHSGDTLYVSDTPARLRRIVFDNVSSTRFDNYYDWPKISVYPNPSNGIFNIEWSQFTFLKAANIKIVDVMGRAVFDKLITTGDIKLDLSQEPSGQYFLIISNSEFSISKKLVIN